MNTKELMRSIIEVLNSLKKPQALALVCLGFSSGMPFLLSGATLGFWMRDAGASLTTIAFFSWVSLLYGVKILWAPFLEAWRIPLLSKALGQTRALMLLAQIFIFLTILLMGWVGPTPQSNLAGSIFADPQTHLFVFALIVSFLVFSSATLGIAIDSWRVELTHSHHDEALNPSLVSLGARLGILMTSAIILVIAKRWGWPLSVEIIAFAMIIGILGVFLAPRLQINHKENTKDYEIGFLNRIKEPFTQLSKSYAGHIWIIFLIIALYRLPDYLIGPIVTPMYQDTGLDYDMIAGMRASIGLWASLIGLGLASLSLLTLGLFPTMIIGALAGPASNLMFAWMAQSNGSSDVFALSLIVDNLSNSIADTSAVAFLTRLCDKGFAITQYSLLISIESFLGKTLKGFMGWTVDKLQESLSLFDSYSVFFIATAIMALPILLFCIWAQKLGIFKPNTQCQTIRN
jgi:PAT family beta-lactamase induction signal transducer AmpG